MREKKISPPTKFLPLGYNRQEGVDYLIITKERLVLASAHMPSKESFFHKGQKHTISNFFRGIFRWGICPLLWFDSSGAFSPYAPRLDTPIKPLSTIKKTLKIPPLVRNFKSKRQTCKSWLFVNNQGMEKKKCLHFQ